jgi:hypothetical protein
MAASSTAKRTSSRPHNPRFARVATRPSPAQPKTRHDLLNALL